MLYILNHSKFKGDNNQLVGIRRALLNIQPLAYHEVDEEQFDLSLLKDDDYVLVSGQHGFHVAEKIKKQRIKSKVIWSSHLFFDEFYQINPQLWPDYMALPKTLLSKELKQLIASHTQLILTDGVSHAINDEVIEKSVCNRSLTLPPLKTPVCIAIILAGDAPDSRNEQRLFHAVNARKQASLIANYIKRTGIDLSQAVFMITNGPRTGKFNIKTKEAVQPDPHSNGILDKPTEEVSGTFLKSMNEYFPHHKIYFYNFQQQAESAYLSMMHCAIHAEQAIWIVPAESVSMISESTYLSEKGVLVAAYVPSSVNPEHMKIVRAVRDAGLIHFVTEKPRKVDRMTMRLASDQIAQAVFAPVVNQSVENKPILIHKKSIFSNRVLGNISGTLFAIHLVAAISLAILGFNFIPYLAVVSLFLLVTGGLFLVSQLSNKEAVNPKLTHTSLSI